MHNLRGLMGIAKKPGPEEPEIEIKLTSLSIRCLNEVQYDFKSGQYEAVNKEDLIEDLLTLPSRIIHKDDLALQKIAASSQKKKDTGTGGDVSAGELEELYDGVLSKEELAKLDSQPNPFNFSERVSQTTRIPYQTASQKIWIPNRHFLLNFFAPDVCSYSCYMQDHKTCQEIYYALQAKNKKEKPKRNRITFETKAKNIKLKDEEIATELSLTRFEGFTNEVSAVVEDNQRMLRTLVQYLNNCVPLGLQTWIIGRQPANAEDSCAMIFWRMYYEEGRPLI
ncbi:unnamed protein product, partial [Meganyctiphanes norvegica]